ncbi:MAG: ferrous iron transport protein A [Candidatus Bathyarchaeota archaeon]|nr:ferrous iron transport protein A [Candidatus Bathyarchaeota archaeon]
MESRSPKALEVPLTALRDGETGILVSIKAGHGRSKGRGWGFEKRLMDMGLTPGTRVKVVKSAPFHGPLEILVRGSRLALGRGMAERVFVEREKE